jgi:transposase
MNSDITKNMTQEELMWLIGWLEGEGSFGGTANNKAPWISGNSIDEDTIERVCHLLDCHKYQVKNTNNNHKKLFAFRIQRISNIQLLRDICMFFGSRRRSKITSLVKPSNKEDARENYVIELREKLFTYWLAGYLEGEGSFLSGPPSEPHMCALQVTTTDEDVIKFIGEKWGVKYHPCSKRKSHHKQAYIIRKRGSGAVEIMLQIRMHMSKRRQSQIDNAIGSYRVVKRNTNSKLTPEDIVVIRNMRLENMKTREIAKQFNINHSVVSRICNNKSHKMAG